MEQRQHREYSTSGLAVSFAAQGVAIDTISRALVVAESQIRSTIEHAYQQGTLAAMPPATSGDARSAMRVELVNLREKLRDATDLIAELSKGKTNGIADMRGVAGLTWKEATIVDALVRHGRLSKDRLYHEVYGGFGADEQPEPKIVDVFICKIRKKLRPHKIEITTTWGFGYGMDAANIAKLRVLAGLLVSDLPRVVSPPLQPTHAEAYP